MRVGFTWTMKKILKIIQQYLQIAIQLNKIEL